MNYILQINLYLSLFYAFYWLWLRHETFNQLNRFYLIVSAIVSFLVPFWHSEWVQSWFVTKQVNEVFYTVSLDAVFIQAPIEKTTSLLDLLTVVYWIGFLFLLFKSLFLLLKTYLFVRRGYALKANAYSFFNYVKIDLLLDNQKTIFTHEHVHSKELHSFDVLLFELIAAVCWFNPVVYLYKKSVRLLHEFIADEKASRTLSSKADYAVLLVSQQFNTTPEILLSHSFFNQSTLKRRIQMLLKKRSNKRALLKYGFTAPLFIGMMVVASASIAKSEGLETLVKIGESPLMPFDDKIELQSKPVVQDTTQHISTKNEEVFKSVDENPEFIGGTSAMYNYISENLKYPKEAADSKTEGKVFVKFVVKNDGSIGDVSILKGIGHGCDEEVIRIVKAMPKWKPGIQNGKPVNVYYTLPINFTLGEKTEANEPIFATVDENPTFIGGTSAMYNYIGENLKYPKEAADSKTEGKVFVKFVVKKDGSIGDVSILKGIGHGCDNEAKRVIEAMPHWKPGIQDGKPVNVYYTLPINFTLDREKPETAMSIVEVGAKNAPQHVGLITNETPIYYVDGVKVMTIEGINPQDIESINVLKSEDAVKKYGETGKNGVVLITLKKK